MQQERRRRSEYRRRDPAARRRTVRRENEPGYAQKLGNTLMRQIMFSAIILLVALAIKSMSAEKQESVEVFMNDAINRNVTLEDLNQKLADISAENDFVQAVFAAINPNEEKKEADSAKTDPQQGKTQAADSAETKGETTPSAGNDEGTKDQSEKTAADPAASAGNTPQTQNTLVSKAQQEGLVTMPAAAQEGAGPAMKETLAAGGVQPAVKSMPVSLPGLMAPSAKFKSAAALDWLAQTSAGTHEPTAEGEEEPQGGAGQAESETPPQAGTDPVSAENEADAQAAKALAENTVAIYMEGISAVPNTLLYGIEMPEEAFALPVASGEITSDFGSRIDPIDGSETGFHGGLDIACEAEKNAPIHAALAGTVEDVGYEESYGNYVKIRHSDELETLYAHCESVQVKPGDAVEKDQVIARQGMSGRATWYHVHFEVRYLGDRVNPIDYVPAYLSM